MSGGGRAALLVSVDHAVARCDRQKHLQTGDQEASAEPRWGPASAPETTSVTVSTNVISAVLNPDCLTWNST